MAKIEFGKQKNESKSLTTINTSGESNTTIKFNDIHDKSERVVHINDDTENKNLLTELTKLSSLLKENNIESDALDKAKESLKNKDTEGFLFWLKKAGERTLNVSIDKGLPFLAGILTSLLK